MLVGWLGLGFWLDAWKLGTWFLYSHTLDALKGSADSGDFPDLKARMLLDCVAELLAL